VGDFDFMEEKTEKKSGLGFYAALGIAFVALAVAGWLFMSNRPEKEKAPAAETETVVPIVEGNYSMKIMSEGESAWSTATVSRMTEDSYSVVRITVYGPVHYSFTVSEGNSLFSEELGTGYAAYSPRVGKTTLHFEKENFVCELSK